MKFIKTIYLLFFCINTLTPAQQYGYNEEFQVNSFTYSDQMNPQIATINEERFVVCWESNVQDGAGNGIFAQIFDKNGNKFNAEFQVNTYTNHEQSDPQILSLDESKFIICWISYGQDGDSYGIFAQIFDNDGNQIGNEFQINTYSEGSQFYLQIAPLNENKFVICWYSMDLDDESGQVIIAQIFDCNGNKIGTEFQANSYSKNAQYNPQISFLNENKFVICWISSGQDNDGGGIFAQIFDYNGNKIGTEFQANTYSKNAQYNPQISFLNENKFVICWLSIGQDGDGNGIFAQIFDNDGNKIGTEFQVNTFSVYNQEDPQILALNENKFIICWNSFTQDGSGFGVFAQIFDNNGNQIGHEFQINTYSENQQGHPQIALLNENKFIICWLSIGQDGSGSGVFAQIFDNDGNQIGHEFQISTYSEGYQSNSKIALLNENKFIICWQSENQDGSGYGVFGKIFLSEPLNHNLELFDILEPKYDSYLDTNTPKFSWQIPIIQHLNFTWEIEYNLHIAENEEFTNPFIIEGITDTTYQIDTLAAGKTYWWKVLAKTYYGDSLWSSNVNGFFIDHNATEVEDDPATSEPTDFVLEQNYPNPFNPTTTINFTIPANVGTSRDLSLRNITLIVYDVLGNKIKTLVNEQKSPGNYSVNFDCSSALGGRGLTSGIYFYRLTYGNQSATKKMLLLR